MITEAEYLAKASGDEGVSSVWVRERGWNIVWSAGEKWRELHPLGSMEGDRG